MPASGPPPSDVPPGPPPDVVPFALPLPPFSGPPPAPARRTRRRATRRALRRTPAALALVAVAVLFVAHGRAFREPTDVLITDDRSGGTYVREDGRSSAITDLCGSSRQEQIEPSVAIDPRDPDDVIAVGANDHCGARFATGWVGFYRSEDGGATWSRSLVPGFPQDSSDRGRRAPFHPECLQAADPALAFDSKGTLYYAFLCVGADLLGKPALYVARYTRDGDTYRGIVAVHPGGAGFEDKPTLAVDTTGRVHDGSVYVAWTDFSSVEDELNPCTVVLFARSTDGARSFDEPVSLSGDLCGLFADIAVGPGGSVYTAFRSEDKIWIVSSNDGGERFGRPVEVADVRPYTGEHFVAGHAACGDGPAQCAGGLTFPRTETNPAVAVDAAGVHVAWTALDRAGRARVWVQSSPDGRTWKVPGVEVHRSPVGHQWMPDIATDGRHLAVVFLDSRNDPDFSPDLPPGDTPQGTNSGDVVHTMLARSADGGVTWTEQRLSAHASNPNWEVQGGARVPFYGDYLSLSIAGGRGFAAWPDSRDLVPGRDMRETGEDDDHDGFDGHLPCTWVPNDIDAETLGVAVSSCLTAGGLDLNVYGAQFEP